MNNNRHRCRASLTACSLTMGVSALFVAAGAQAQQTVTLDQMVVVGSRAPTKISDLPGTVWVIEPEQFMQQVQAGVPLKEALAQLIPSLDTAPQGRTNYGQNMRGRSVLVMINGVSLNSSRGVSRQFDSIDPFNILRIEVLSGATALYGGGATGGIINIVTRRGEPGGPEFTTQAGATSGFNADDDYEARLAQSISGGTEDVRARLGVAAQKNGGFYDANGEQIIPDISQTDLQYNRSVDILGTLDIDLGGGQTLGFTAQFYDSRYDGDEALYLGEDLGAVTGAEPQSFDIRDGFETDREPATRRHLLIADYHNPEVLGQEFYLQGYTRSEELAFHPFPYVAGGYYSASEQNTDLHGLKALFVSDLDPVRLQWGVDVSREEFDGNQMLFDYQLARETGGLKLDETAVVGRYPSYRVDGVAGFLQADWQATDRLRFSAGLRQQYNEVHVDDFVDKDQQVDIAQGEASSADAVPGGSNDYDVTLINAGVVFDVNLANQLWANFSQGFEVPDVGKYYGQGEYQLVGGRYVLTDSVNVEDSPLQGIKTNQVEIGWRHFGDRVFAQVATYYAWSDEALAIQDDLSITVEDQETRDYGIEAKLVYRIDPAWRIGGSGHLVRSEIKNSEGEWQRRAATQASLSKATAFVGWSRRALDLRLQLTRAFDLEDDQGNEINGFHTVDLLGSYRLPVGTLAFGIQNLLNEDYTTVWGQRAQMFYAPYFGPEEMFDFKGRGRTYTLTYTVHY